MLSSTSVAAPRKEAFPTTRKKAFSKPLASGAQIVLDQAPWEATVVWPVRHSGKPLPLSPRAASQGQWRFHPYRRDAPALFSEEDTPRIHAKRTNAIDAVKRGPMYRLAHSLCTTAVSPAAGLTAAPRTPDPLDMSVSKLQWEASVLAWRSALWDLAMQVEEEASAVSPAAVSVEDLAVSGQPPEALVRRG